TAPASARTTGPFRDSFLTLTVLGGAIIPWDNTSDELAASESSSPTSREKSPSRPPAMARFP
ncbi:hypothetical protein HN011_009799, partial [Eciton burchellii]